MTKSPTLFGVHTGLQHTSADNLRAPFEFEALESFSAAMKLA